MKKNIFIVAGGTGGHMFPALELFENFETEGLNTIFVTDKRGVPYIEKKIIKKQYILDVETPSTKNLVKFILNSFKVFFSLLHSIILLIRNRPTLVFGLGGYVTFPVCLASKILRIPILLYENNLILGRANKYLLPLCFKLFVNNEDIIKNQKRYSSKIIYVGNILRKKIIDRKVETVAKDENIFSILILGGSQGAEIFGKIVHKVIKKISDSGYKLKVFQQCTDGQEEFLKSFYSQNNIENYIFKFREDLSNIITLSDIAISRCGASTLAELEYLEVPFIAVPYPFALDNHQYFNARYYHEKGSCHILQQKDFTLENLFKLLISLTKDRSQLIKMKKNMQSQKKINSFENILKNIRKLL